MRGRAFAIAIVASSAGASCGFDGAALVLAPADAAIRGTAYQVSAGQASTCALVLGAALCWGSNVEGGLGTGDTQDQSSPVAVQTSAVFSSVVVGDVHACGLEVGTNQVDCWGGNSFGQLGSGDGGARAVPAAVGLGQSALEISAGYEFSCAVLADRSLWCWGENDEGQLGQGDTFGAGNSAVPLRVASTTPWMHVAAGQGHACGIQSPGTLWCWGRNTSDELGLGPNQAIQIRTPTRLGVDQDWAAVDLGQDSACALKQDGSLWCWGANTFDQLGFAGGPDAGARTAAVPTRVDADTDWAEVSIDTFDACGVKRDGTLWCWGRNLEGQLGLGDNVNRSSPTQVAADGQVGGSDAAGGGWLSVSVGRFHTCAETIDHAVLCTGQNHSGALGLGDVTDRNAFVRVALPSAP
jgi:alpha-tubulin suppressor-like RCC1 family protein